jgi:hypothetical protein
VTLPEGRKAWMTISEGGTHRHESSHCQPRANQNKYRTTFPILQSVGATMQNTSHAVMAQRAELKNSLDDFPTPPWATRALVEHVIASKDSLSSMTCLEPACGRGHMSVTLAHYFRDVASFDVFDYSFGVTCPGSSDHG